MTLVRVVSRLSLFKDSSHTCPLRMAVRVRPLACLKYSESCRVVGASELKAVFSLQWRAVGETWGCGQQAGAPHVCALGIFTQLSSDASGNRLWEEEAAVSLSLVKPGSKGRQADGPENFLN